MKSLFGLAFLFALPTLLPAHGSLQNGRMLQVRLAGPNGNTPAPWNDSYYTWNQNSQNFPTYNQAGFSYSTFMPDGTIADAGINDGVHTSLNFTGLNNPSPNWQTTAVTAGNSLHVDWLATATHDPSYFEVYLTKQSFNADTQVISWEGLDYIGRWAVGDANRPVIEGTSPNPISGGTMPSYTWDVPIPTDRSGHIAMLVIWQRVDPAGEAFIAVQDLAVTAAVNPTLSVTMGAGSVPAIHLKGAPNKSYRVDATGDLSANSWSALETAATDGNGALDLTDPAASALSQRFYRAVSQ